MTYTMYFKSQEEACKAWLSILLASKPDSVERQRLVNQGAQSVEELAVLAIGADMAAGVSVYVQKSRTCCVVSFLGDNAMTCFVRAGVDGVYLSVNTTDTTVMAVATTLLEASMDSNG